MISRKTIDEVLSRASLSDVIGEVVQLRRAGRNLIGLCPFHSERTGSFNVREDQGFYHCFGCGKSGNVISFIMEYRGLSFPESVEFLAGRLGVPVEYDISNVRKKGAAGAELQEYYRANRAAFEFYVKSLQSAPSEVREYLNERGVTAESCTRFGIGFAPKSWSALTDHLKKLKFSEEFIARSGLARRSQRGELFDIMRGRIIFPIWLDSRRIVAFGGRLVPSLESEGQGDGRAPKYLNSPETAVYQKQRVLYGLPQALPSLREKRELYLVEGYMDVVGMSQAGAQNVVATCGTAVTPHHARRLSKLVRRLILLFDGDQAGRRAAGRCFEIFLNSGIDVQAGFLPDGEDPDTFAHKVSGDPAAGFAALPRRSLFEGYLHNLMEKFEAAKASELGAAAKGQIASEVAALLKQVTNAVERSEYVEKAASFMRIERRHLEALIEGTSAAKIEAFRKEDSQPGSGKAPEKPPELQEVSSLPKLDQQLLYAVMGDRLPIIDEILRDPTLCSRLASTTLHFIQAFAALLRDPRQGEGAEPVHKEQVRALLTHHGKSWLQHWKTAYAMKSEGSTDFLALLRECRRWADQDSARAMLKELDSEINGEEDEQRRAELSARRVEISRRLAAI